MARTATRLQIRDDARAHSDTVSSTHTTDTQLNRWINQELAALWDILVAADVDRYVKTYQFTATSGTTSYTLPSDFYKPRGLDRVIGDDRVSIDEWQFHERNRYSTTTGTPDDYSDVRYRIMGQGIDGTDARIRFEGDPGSYTYELWYVQAPQTLDADGDTFDGVAGWEDWIAYSVAIRILNREESDPTMLLQERAQIERRIANMATGRASGSPPRIQDTRNRRRSRLQARL